MSKTLAQSPTEAVVAEVNRVGLKRAARKFNTSQASLCRWLKAQQYKRQTIYIKVEKSA